MTLLLFIYVPSLKRSHRTTHIAYKYKDFHLANFSISDTFNVVTDYSNLFNVLYVHEPNLYF